jgi:VanZ family protein
VTRPSATRRAVAVLLALVWAALIFGGSSGEAPGFVTDLEVPDYLLHVAEYAVLGLLLSRMIFLLTLQRGFTALVLVPALLAAAYGISDELHQSFVPGRDPSPSDVLADLGGGLLGAFLYRAVFAARERRAVAAAVLLLALAGSVSADPGADPLAGAAEGITRKDVLRHAEMLASPEMGGRDTPSAGLDLAARYLAVRMKSYGLEPGARGSWFQPVPMRYRKETGQSFLRVLERAGNREFRGRDVAVLRGLPDGEGAGPLVFAGYGMSVPKLQRDDYAGLDVRGKVVLVFTGFPGGRDRSNPYLERGDRELAEQRRIAGKAKLAADRGAVALVAVNGPLSRTVDRLQLIDGTVLEGKVVEVAGGYRVTVPGWSRRTLAPAEVDRIVLKDGTELRVRSRRRTRLDVVVGEETRFVPGNLVREVLLKVPPLPKSDLRSGLLREGRRPEGPIPVLLVSASAAEVLIAGTGKSLRELQQGAEKGGAPFEVADRAAVVRVRTEVEEKRAVNVVGRLTGRENPDEALLLSAHYDHVGVGRHGEIYHGADDNASGVSTVLEVARALAGLPGRPRRTILFAFFAGEEKGFFGSRAFVDHPPVPLERISAVLNLDMMGRGVGDEVYVYVGARKTRLPEVLRASAEAARLRPDYVPVTEWEERRGRFGRSDHVVFYKKGIPAAFFVGDDHEDYHRPTDTWDKLNAEKLVRVGRFVLRVAHRISEEGLPREPEE